MTLKVNKKVFLKDYEALTQKEMANKYGVTTPTILKLVRKYRKLKRAGRRNKIELI